MDQHISQGLVRIPHTHRISIQAGSQLPWWACRGKAVFQWRESGETTLLNKTNSKHSAAMNPSRLDSLIGELSEGYVLPSPTAKDSLSVTTSTAVEVGLPPSLRPRAIVGSSRPRSPPRPSLANSPGPVRIGAQRRGLDCCLQFVCMSLESPDGSLCGTARAGLWAWFVRNCKCMAGNADAAHIPRV